MNRSCNDDCSNRYAGLDNVIATAAATQRWWERTAAFPCPACCPCEPNRTSGNFRNGCKKFLVLI